MPSSEPGRPSALTYILRVAEPYRPGSPLRLHWFNGLMEVYPTAAAAPQLDEAPLLVGDWVLLELDEVHKIKSLERLCGAADSTRDVPSRFLEGDVRRWRKPVEGPGRSRLLAFRHRVLRTVRDWFDGQDFIEVDTPCLVRAPSPEPQFSPVAAGEGWLITSPEFQMKRLLVGGMVRIMRIGPAFRGGETGQHHNPEFTLLEWYRVHGRPHLGVLAADLAALLQDLAPLTRGLSQTWQDLGTREDELKALADELARGSLPQVTVADLVQEHTGVDLRGVMTEAALRDALRAADAPEAALEGDFTLLFSALWVRLEPHLPQSPLLVVDWPAPLASLARLKPGDPTVAERMELYVRGVELANGFVELTDPAEQRRRFEADRAARSAQGLPPVPLDERFLSALEEGMPPCVGMALGVDRLVMVLSGAPDLASVLPFSVDEL